MKSVCGVSLLATLIFGLGSSTAYALPDYVGSIDIEVEGQEITFTFRVENKGDEPATDLLACYFFDLDHAPINGQDIQDGCIDIAEGLQPGEEASVEKVLTKDPGTYAAWMVVDPIKLTLEINEADNVVGPVSYMVTEEVVEELFPDLIVEDPKVIVGEKLTISATVRNVGEAPSGSITFIDLYYTGGSEADAFLEVPDLDVDGSFEAVFEEALPDPGDYGARLHVDPYDEIVESDEDNMTPEVAFVVKDPDAVEADLSADALKVIVTEEQAVQVELSLSNKGAGASGQFVWSLYADLESAPTAEIESEATVAHGSILPGESVVAKLPNPIQFFPGNHELWVFVDPNAWVFEEIWDNNIIGPIPFSVGGPQGNSDLVIDQFLPVVGANRQINYEVHVTNAGTEATGPFYLDVIFDSEVAPSAEMDPFPEGLAHFDEVGLAPGESATYSLQRELAPLGVYASWAVVDLFDLVLESDETNNLAGPIEVEVQDVEESPDLAIDLFKAKVEGNRVLYLVECVNQGTRRAGAFVAGLYRNRSDDEAPQYGDEADALFNVESVEAGETVQIGFLWEPAPDGAVQAWVFVDLDNSVEESDEANNRAGPRLILVDSTAESCVADEAVEAPCICGNETIYQGYCCESVWSLSSCDQPIDQGEGEESVHGLSWDAIGSPDVITLNNGQSDGSSGCQLSRF